jgi:hypothetical protein
MIQLQSHSSLALNRNLQINIGENEHCARSEDSDKAVIKKV